MSEEDKLRTEINHPAFENSMPGVWGGGWQKVKGRGCKYAGAGGNLENPQTKR